ncbi:MAG: DUF86 domain-containing protein [Nitrospirae bacterium]|nr:DUF86 domain-containing protein [Nitrospirota bacterium]
MVISRLDINKIEKSLSVIQEFLIELRKLSDLSIEEFLADKRNPSSAESYLRRSLEAIFDISRHILAKTYGFKEIEYKNIARQLGEKGIIEKEYSKTLMKMAGYRNRMVHLYHEISSEEIYNILKYHLSDIERFISDIVLFIEKSNKKTI